MLFKSIVQNIVSLSKTWCVYAREALRAFSSVCVILCFCNLCSCVQVLSHWSNLCIRLLTSVRHHVNLQCITESGSLIVLFAAVRLFSYMFPHHVLS